MIIYNETIIVEDATYDEWLRYMQQTHIPAVMATGCFSSYRILKVIDSPNEGITTCIQYNADDLVNFNQFFNQYLHGLQATHQQQFENKFVLFNTLMEELG